jgi:enoyl-[acyl-carrier protein] reductase I
VFKIADRKSQCDLIGSRESPPSVFSEEKKGEVRNSLSAGIVAARLGFWESAETRTELTFMDFLELSGKTVLVLGLANRKSVAWHAGNLLREAGARVVWSVRTEERRLSAGKLIGADEPIFVCDVERQVEIDRLRESVAQVAPKIHGIVHSLAYADYSFGRRPFHQAPRAAFLQAVDISCYSLIAMSEAFRELLDPDQASVVTVSISTTRMAAENYGYMAPVKAALDSTVCFLAKSFSEFSRVRFNAVCPGLLKTSASAGIPGYVDSYLFAEKATLRKKGVLAEEVAPAIAFLLSPRSAGINAQGIVIDAGMGINYFDRTILGDAGGERPT